MEDIKLTYEEMLVEGKREAFIDSIISGLIGAGLMAIIVLIFQLF